MRPLPLLSALFALTIPAASHAAEHADVLLVLAADVSRSISSEKFDLQRKGYAAAMGDPQVIDAIASQPNHRIAVAFVEWSGDGSETLVVDWSLVGSKEQAEAFGMKVLNAPRAFANRTAIGAGIAFASQVLTHCPFTGDRAIIDVSGDGTNNDGIDVRGARDAALAHGVTTINGLVILSPDTNSSYLREHEHPEGGLQNYYRQNVAGGPGAFVLTANSFESFGRSLVAKLVQEIS